MVLTNLSAVRSLSVAAAGEHPAVSVEGVATWVDRMEHGMFLLPTGAEHQRQLAGLPDRPRRRLSDEATSRLITEFLRHWRAGKPRVEALREAQLSLLRSKEFASPYFWAAFTLTGQWR